MITDVRDVHPWKTDFPREVTPLGMVTDVRDLQSKKAPCSIEVHYWEW